MTVAASPYQTPLFLARPSSLRSSMSLLFNSSRRWSLAGLVVAALFFLFILRPSLLTPDASASDYLPQLKSSHRSGTCSPNLSLLRHHGLISPDQDTVKYAQLQLTPSFSSKEAPDQDRAHRLNVKLPELRSIPHEALTHDSTASKNTADTPHNAQKDLAVAQASITLPPVPKKQPDASHIVFGVATTARRLNDSLEAFSHWASDNGARIHAIVEPDSAVREVKQRAQKMGIKLDISESIESMDDRYFSHVKLFQSLKQPHTEWMAFIDDDTFFLSIADLLEMLSHYDASEPHYIGGLSENAEQVASWGLWAFGGAGVFLSTPLLDQLAEHYDECFDIGFTADWRISQCIYQHTTTKLSWEQGLHQMDLAMDQSGFYEAGRQLPLSIHHYKSWIQLDVAAMTAVSAIAGVDSVLKRFFLRDGWVLTNGYSIVHYSNGWAGDDATIEKTWEGFEASDRLNVKRPGTNFLHSLGPLREKDLGKQSYRLRTGSVEAGGDVVRQFYVGLDNVEVGSIIEVCWQAR